MKKRTNDEIERRVQDQAAGIAQCSPRGKVHRGRRGIREVPDTVVPVLQQVVEEVRIKPYAQAVRPEPAIKQLKDVAKIRDRGGNHDGRAEEPCYQVIYSALLESADRRDCADYGLSRPQLSRNETGGANAI